MTELATAERRSLGARLEALHAALDLADGRLSSSLVEQGRAVEHRASRRLRVAPDATVAALAGATGSGKSSLFNVLVGDDLAEVGARRPTTSEPLAAVFGPQPVGALLDGLDVPRRHLLTDAGPNGLVLVDLPDHDSTETAHRLTVDRMVAEVDLLVWVLDPQKYADAAVHDRYLRPLASHRDVMLVVLNQADRLDPPSLRACLADLARLLDEDGLEGVPLLAVSARTGSGIEDLRTSLGGRVLEKRAAVQRLQADVDVVVHQLSAGCGETSRSRRSDRSDREVATLTDALADAASVDLVVLAVGRSHRREASGATGWPFTRWIRRVRPDPLGRLHLGPGVDAGDVTSLPPPSAVARARVDTALRTLADSVSTGLVDPWPGLVRRVATDRADDLVGALDATVAQTELGTGGRRPRWWSLVGVVQGVLAVAAVVGAIWLGLLFALGWLRLPDPPLPRLGEVPVPTVLLLGGLVLGVLLAALARRLAASGARRRGRRARTRLLVAIGDVVQTHALDPVDAELSVHRDLCEAVGRARG